MENPTVCNNFLNLIRLVNERELTIRFVGGIYEFPHNA